MSNYTVPLIEGHLTNTFTILSVVTHIPTGSYLGIREAAFESIKFRNDLPQVPSGLTYSPAGEKAHSHGRNHMVHLGAGN